jgi:hypothetical protein
VTPDTFVHSIPYREDATCVRERVVATDMWLRRKNNALPRKMEGFVQREPIVRIDIPMMSITYTFGTLSLESTRR